MQTGNNGEDLSGIVQIAAAEDHVCAVSNQGEVWCWGIPNNGRLGHNSMTNTDYYPEQVLLDISGHPTLAGAAQVATGRRHSCAAMINGQVRCWGKGDNGALGIGNHQTKSTAHLAQILSDAISITAGDQNSCVMRSSVEEPVLLGGPLAKECWEPAKTNSLAS